MPATPGPEHPTPPHAVDPANRRHDLDALRAVAMLLGIGLHAALSFATIPWIVQDTQQNGLFGLFFVAIHGFRMPLFFLISGYFTAMLYRRRGPAALLKQRAQRILLPLLLGLVTIVPAMDAISAWAVQSQPKATAVDDGTIIGALRMGDTAALDARLAAATAPGSDPALREGLNRVDAYFGVSPLAWAALRGDEPAVRRLLDAGADPGSPNRDQNTPLHAAAFLGHDTIAALLVERGADPNRRSPTGGTALASTEADLETTKYLADLLALPLPAPEALAEGRAAVRRRLEPLTTAVDPAATGDPGAIARVRRWYHENLDAPWLDRKAAAGGFHLIKTDVFHHLWFLWFLCWLAPLYVLFAWLGDRAGGRPGARPWLALALIPLTLIPQLLMGADGPSFGPDTATGVLLPPHLLLYYGLFFGFGALMYDAGDLEGRLGRGWRWILPLALFLVLPLGLATMGDRSTSAVAQVAYAWLMSFGMIGLFRRHASGERPAVRYLSDAAYWLYLAHLPLIIAGQALIRTWPAPASLKFLLLCTVVTGLLLIVYQLAVRNTPLGTLLNGPRRPASKAT